MSIEAKLIEAINNTLRNSLYEAMRELGIGRMLKASKLRQKREGKPLGGCCIFCISGKISTYVSQAKEGYAEDVYYRFLKDPRYNNNWKRLLEMLNLPPMGHRTGLQESAQTLRFRQGG